MRRLAVLTLLLLPWAASAQEDDRTYLTALLEDNLSGVGRKVTITGFAGALSSKATISEITIADASGIWLTLRDIELDWNRSALLAGAVSVNALTAGEIIVARPPISEASGVPSPEAKGFSLPELPVSVNIGRIAAERIELGAPVLGTALEGTLEAALTLANGDGTGNLLIERTDSGPEGRLALTASYGNASRQLVIDLDAREDAGGIASVLLGLPGAPSVELIVQGEGPISDFTADVRLGSDGSDRLAGNVTLQSTDAMGQAFSADLGGDLAPLFLPEFAEFFGSDVQLKTTGVRAPTGRFDLSQFSVQTRAMTLGGTLVLAADGLPERFALTGKLGLDSGEDVLLPLTTQQQTYVQTANLALGFDAVRDEGWRGTLAVTGLRRNDFAAETLALIGSGRISRPGGSVDQMVGGTVTFAATGLAPTDPDLAAALGTKVDGKTTFYWQSNAPLNLQRFALNGDGFALLAGGQVSGLESGITITGKATAQLDDLARGSGLAGRELAGSGVAEVSGTASLLAGSFDLEGSIAGTDLRFDQTELDNLLRGESTIDFAVKRDETGTLVRQLDIAASTLVAKAFGTIATAGSDLTADLSFSDMAALGANFRGAMTGRARFFGTIASGDLTIEAQGDGLGIGQPEVDVLLRGKSNVALDARLEDNVIALRSLTVTAATMNAAVTGRVATNGSDLNANLVFSDLAALGGGYRGALNGTAKFTGTPEDGVLVMDAVVNGLAVGQPEVDRLLRGQSRVAAALDLKDGKIKINSATLANPQINVEADGSVSAGNRQVTLSARLVDLGVLLPEFPGQVTVIGMAIEDAQGYRLDLQGKGPGQIDATVKGRVAQGLGSADLTIVGSAQAGLANAFITPRALSGALRFDLRLNGPLRPSSLSGRISLESGKLSDPGLAFSLNALTASGDLAGGRMRVDAAADVSTGGRVEMVGSVGLAAPYDAELRANLGQVRLRDPRLYQTTVNGTVRVNGPLAGGALVAGDIVLSETEVRIPSTGLGSAGGIPDLRHINEPADVRATRTRAGLIATDSNGAATGSGRPYALDLNISAPNQMFVRGRGLDAELGGALRLGGTTANVVPSGAFNLIRGRLDILGKRLNLSEALLQLEGEFVPFVRILASTEGDGITSSVLIEGQATEPKVSFVSSPELPEEEVLARLLFGRALTSLSALQAAQLAGAVATLAGKGGEGIVGKLRAGFGLDDLDFVTNEEGGASLKAGKYLSKNLYTEVIVDQAGQSQINLNLDITPDITLRGSTSTDGTTGLGIFMEKDY
ncbi:MAG: translocation/assembly module TamB domain-containing protein [Paracoccaceae bacterium]